jgi:TolB protein
LTPVSSNDGNPASSPTGEELAFVSNRTGNYQIYVMNAANGSSQRRIASDQFYDADRAWTNSVVM